MALNHGVIEEDVGIDRLQEYPVGVRHFVEGAADRDEVGEKLVGVMEVVAEKMAVDFSKAGAGVAAMEEAEEPPLYLSAASGHVLERCTWRERLRYFLLGIRYRSILQKRMTDEIE
ncbi:Uncharacterized protein Fot_28931 [Forsythia ovata]|uniref:Uncharacterized protein n=1 Tax=Forsythia ovata TaxID=205694 RepID=A0ABD1TQF2_9LAMI